MYKHYKQLQANIHNDKSYKIHTSAIYSAKSIWTKYQHLLFYLTWRSQEEWGVEKAPQ